MNNVTKQSIFDLCKKYDTVFILDVFNYVFKYYFAHKELSIQSKLGETIPTGHIYGFLKNLLFLKEKFPNCAIVMAIDGIDNQRREVNPEYKANRHHEIEPSEYIDLIMGFCSLVEGVYTCYDANFEADDIVNSVSKDVKYLCDKYEIQKQVYILSTDKDMYQLVSDKGFCKVNSVKKWGLGDKWFEEATIIDEKGVMEVFEGVAPENLLKFRAIVGDSSDNLKGYYRFFKKNAAIVANNFDYDIEKQALVMKDGVEMHESWKKFLNKIFEDISVLDRNYKVMAMKKFDYELNPVFIGLTEDTVKTIIDTLSIYEMHSYMRGVSKYSPYKDWVIKALNSIEDGEDDMPVEDIANSIMGDLSSLL